MLDFITEINIYNRIYLINTCVIYIFSAERRAQLNRSRSRGPGGHGSPQTKEIVYVFLNYSNGNLVLSVFGPLIISHENIFFVKNYIQFHNKHP